MEHAMRHIRAILLPVVLLVLLYILLGNARSVQPNPIVPGAIVAVNMVVPVLAGIFYGPWAGLAVGAVGTFANTLSPAGNEFEMLAILPHAVMGLLAGLLSRRYPTPVAAFALLFGHMANIAMFSFFLQDSVFPEAGILVNARFWQGLAFEAFAGILTVIVVAAIFRIIRNELKGKPA